MTSYAHMSKGQDHTTAILVFAHSSTHELGYKPMVKGEQIFEALTQRTLKIVRKTGLPYFHFTETQQRGSSFKERFVNALNVVFEKGYENVITLGNDTPQLSTADLNYAHEQLKANKIVLGPSADGGIYLMGMHRSNFDPVEFLELPWQSAQLGKALLQIVSRQKNVVLLKTLFDLDNHKDLSLFISRFKTIGNQFLTAIPGLISSRKAGFQYLIPSLKPLYNSIFFNKGSPAVSMATLV